MTCYQTISYFNQLSIVSWWQRSEWWQQEGNSGWEADYRAVKSWVKVFSCGSYSPLWWVQWQSIISRDHTPPPHNQSSPPDKGNIFLVCTNILAFWHKYIHFLTQIHFLFCTKNNLLFCRNIFFWAINYKQRSPACLPVRQTTKGQFDSNIEIKLVLQNNEANLHSAEFRFLVEF